ncbi:MAG: hypothetical protein OXN89_03515 [Bryobacterales bacterium]|nr:hypothetical protein [Bryobacterales bacterium]
MRTTLDIDEDVLLAAGGLAKQSKKTIGAVISELVRKGLNAAPGDSSADQPSAFFGFHPLPKCGKAVTNEIIGHLRDSGPY